MWYSADAIPFSESTNAGAAPVAIPSLSATRTPGMTAKLEHTKHTNWTGGGGGLLRKTSPGRNIC